MKAFAIACAGMAISALAGCGQSDREVALRFADGLTASDIRLVEQGMRTFFEVCPGVARYWQDLSPEELVTVAPTSASNQRQYGWDRSVSIVLRVAADPRGIPPSYRAWGRRCRYDVGVVEPQGVAIAESPCASVCKDAAADSPAFVPARKYP